MNGIFVLRGIDAIKCITKSCTNQRFYFVSDYSIRVIMHIVFELLSVTNIMLLCSNMYSITLNLPFE